MKFSERWLREWVNPALTTAELVKQLTMAGLEVDSVTPVAPAFTHVVVGEVLAIAPHPQAERLQVCQVNVGNADSLTIVCGATNVKVGMRVPTALVGAKLPNNITIKSAKLRGVLSAGMLCSATELGLAETAEGILPLAADAPIGQDFRYYWQLDDMSLEVDLTPNRGDCLGVEGIAREVGVLSRCAMTPIACHSVPATITDTLPVTILNPQTCPRYVGRIINNINAQAPTPLWMQERLRRSGLRSISAVVDITNYLLLELGQPMHAFDLAKLSGGIQVRLANAGETLALLDGQTVSLDAQTLVIADNNQAQAMAGVMGGQAAAVSDTTQAIFLESAFFSPALLSGCARRYGLHTDSSHRFERGVDPQLQRRACERATALLLEIVGGQAGEIIEVVDTTALPIIPTITLRASRIQRLLGDNLDSQLVTELLTRLGMTVEQTGDTWRVQPPDFRFDIRLEADLIEELARIHGYDNLPRHAPQTRLTMQPQPLVTVEKIRTILVQRGYQEAITYSFVDPQSQAKINPDAVSQTMTLANPIASDMAVMRTTLWTGLLQAVVYNQKRQQPRVRLFETGLRFIKTADKLQQERMVAGIVTGSRYPEQWGITTQPVDFFDIKADVEILLKLSHLEARFVPNTHAALHPGQTAAIYQGDTWLGWLGAIHPSLMQALDLSPPVYLFELRLDPLYQAQLPQYQEVSKYPSVRRDIAVVVDKQVSAAELLATIRQAATELLVDWQLFDLYQGEGIESGKKSLAIGLIFQSFSRNLTELEVDSVLEQILHTLKQNLDAQLRK